MKIAIIGVGGTGSATARFLAQRGHEVVGFEQFQVGHARGSSHGESRIIRYTYPDSFHTRLMARAYPLWADLENAAGEELLVRCGGILFGPPHHARVVETQKALESAGLPFEILDQHATRERFPALHLKRGEIALWQEGSGFLRSTACVLANVRLAREAGAEIREITPVFSIEEENGKVWIETSNGREAFDRVIVTAGAWMGKILSNLNLPLRVEQRQFVYLQIARNEEFFAPARLPVWIDADESFYGFPRDGRVAGVKLASHVLGTPFNPDEDARPIVEANVEVARDYARQRFPDLSDEVAHAQACLYTLTPDENFIVDEAPGLQNVLLVSGCSGHGFKFTVLLGKIAATWAMGGVYDEYLSPWKLARFNHL